jgi:predicted N-acyltransferase
LGQPLAHLDVNWKDIDGYVAHLRTRSGSAARHVRQELRKNRDSGVVIRRLMPDADSAARLDSVVRDHFRQKNGEDPPYPPSFFSTLIAMLPEDFLIFEAHLAGRTLGMLGVIRSGSVASAPWLGMTADGARHAATYFGLAYYHLADQAASLGIRRILYGTTVYEAKTRRGCVLTPTRVFYRPRSRAGRLLGAPYVRLHETWYQRKYP